MGNEVRERVSKQAGHDKYKKRHPLSERYCLYKMRCKPGFVKSKTKSEPSGNHPEHIPVKRLELFLSEHAGRCENADRNHCHNIGVETVKFLGHPQEDSHDESHHHNPIALVLVWLTLYFELNLVDLEREHNEQHRPRNKKHHNGERHHHGAPFRETNACNRLESRSKRLVCSRELSVDGLDE